MTDARRTQTMTGALPRAPIAVGGPFYEDLAVGDVFDSAPALTLTGGQAALHQATLGDRLRLPLDATLSQRVTGRAEPLAHPGLVWDVTIGQSTIATQRVIANLFYRGFVFHRAPVIGDTLHTSTEVVALRDTSPRPGRPPTGLAALRIRTLDQDDRPVLDFHRCAMLPMRDEQARPGHADDLDQISDELPADALHSAAAAFDLDAYRAALAQSRTPPPDPDARYTIQGGETVSAAPELARLTLNIAAAHHDPDAGGRGQRLVYGGHTIGLALSHVTRAFPDLVTVLGWRRCDHLAPVYEGDVLHSSIEVTGVEPLASGRLLELRVITDAVRSDGERREAVLDWRLVGLLP